MRKTSTDCDYLREKKTQTLADQAWEKVRATGSLQQGLEAECTDLQNKLVKYQQDHDALLMSCGLLAGALYSAYNRISALCTQRHLLEQQIQQLEYFKEQVTKSVASNTDQKPVEKCVITKPILRFRVAVISVLAANRLIHIGQNSQKAFIVRDLFSRGDSITVLAGSPNLASGSKHEKEKSGKAVANWLNSPELHRMIVTAVTELQDHITNEDEGMKQAASKSFRWLVDQLSTFFSVQPQEMTSGFREKSSMLKMLGHGLLRCSSSKLVSRESEFTSQVSLRKLQNLLANMKKKLSKYEGINESLEKQVDEMKQIQESRSKDDETVVQLHREFEKLQDMAKTMVSHDKFNGVCEELSSALRREEQAQELLNEQSQQLHILSQKLDLQASSSTDKEKTIKDTNREMNELKQEIKRKEQHIRQLNRQNGQLETESKSLMENVKDAENALRTAAKDKEALNMYMKSVELALEQFKIEVSKSGGKNMPALNLLQPKEHRKTGPELAHCQLLVTNFIDTIRQVYLRIGMLSEEIASHQEHIKVLKCELNAACRREYDVEHEFGAPDRQHVPVSSKWYDKPAEIAKEDNFTPLIEDQSSLSLVPEPTPTIKAKPKRLSASPINHSTPNNKPSPDRIKRTPVKNLQPKVKAK